MSFMFFLRIKVDNNIIYINSSKFAQFSKQSIYLFLYIRRQILIFHNSYIKNFLIAIIDDNKFVFII